MIVLKNVTKIYKSKTGQFCTALKDINLQLPSKGLVFICGKSGSGKSTLLNILGLLDAPDSGQLLIDGREINLKKEADAYRNDYIGFVFQDFNLLENETVERNLLLALRLQNKRDEKEVKKTLENVELHGYEKKLAGELSGGEKQRVAIGRALIKKSKMILADEPTGNLDSETAEAIFKLLKQIAKEKLVVVVTHDRDFAETYGDYFIEMKDGKIINAPLNLSENLLDIKNSEDATNIIHGERAGLPTSYALKMGLSNLVRKKAKSILTILLAVICISALGFAQIFITFSTETALAKTAEKNGITTLSIYQSNSEIFSPYSEWIEIEQSIYKEELANQKYIKNINGYYILSSLAQAKDFDIEFYCAEELSDDCVYVTDYTLEKMINLGLYFLDGAEYKEYVSSVNTYEDILCKPLKRTTYEYDYKIAGVVKTEYRKYYDETCKEYQTPPDDVKDDRLWNAEKAYAQKYLLNQCYCTQNYVGKLTKRVSFDKEEFAVQAETQRISNLDKLTIELLNNYTGYAATAQGLMKVSELTISPKEIVVTSDLYNLIFQEDLTYEEYIGNNGEAFLKKIPSHLGDCVKLNIQEIDSKNTIYKDEAFTVAGVIIEPTDLLPDGSMPQNYNIYAHQDVLLQLAEHGYSNTYSLLKLGDYKESLSLLQDLREKNVLTEFTYSQPIYDNEQMQRNIGFTFVVFGVVLAIITVLITISLISFSILEQTKEIGILRALGAKNRDIYKIYLLESFLISIVSFVFSFVLSIVSVAANNAIMSNATLNGIIFIGFTPITFLTIFIASIFLINVFALIPLRKVSKLKPIQAIKN